MTSPPRRDSEDRRALTDQAFIRRMSAADVDSVFALERATAEAPHWPRREYEAILAALPEDGSLTRVALVAELAGELAGFAVVRLLRLAGADADSGQVDCELETIVVAASFRGRGIGFLSMNAALDLAISHEAGRFELEVRASNEAAIRLYARAGLAVSGRRPSYFSDPPEDALLMAKELSPSRISRDLDP